MNLLTLGGDTCPGPEVCFEEGSVDGSSPPPLYPADLPFSSYVDIHLNNQLS